MQLDALIFGGGVAGLWLLDELTRAGQQAVLLEAAALGSGQTIGSQGIIHGGAKYTLQGLLTPSAAGVRDMPAIWRECLSGQREPDLSKTLVRAECCHLWRTESVGSRLGMIGAKFGLNVAPESISMEDRPCVLAACPGTVAKLPEQVISPRSLLDNFKSRHASRILKIGAGYSVQFRTSGAGNVEEVSLLHLRSSKKLKLNSRCVVFAAGQGNAELRSSVGLSTEAMQRRPLHMVLARGRLPILNGHCVDGAKTRVTITSDTDSAGRTVWQIGGQIAEDGVALDGASLIERAQTELQSVIPNLDLQDAEFATYRVDRAEGAMPGGKRPETSKILCEGNTITAWPTKLVLAPRLAADVAEIVTRQPSVGQFDVSALASWSRPEVALPPWETAANWTTSTEFKQRRAA